MSMLALKLVNECFETKSPMLDLGNCSLLDKHFMEGRPLDLALRKCIHLEKLILSNTWIVLNTGEWVSSPNKADKNSLRIIPAAIRSLVNLSTFICSGDQESRGDITNTSPISHLPNLRHLDISRNNITIVEPLIGCEKLEVLNLDHNAIINVEGLDALTDLRELYLSNNKISEIKGLSSLEKLENLHLAHNNISEINGLNKLTNLEVLNLDGNKISEIKGLEALTKIENLHLSQNNLQKIQGVERLKRLFILDLSYNKIADIKGIESLVKLQFLNLSCNKIKSIRWLQSLKELDYLHLRENRIVSIKPLESLTNLRRLYISGNQLINIKSLSKLSKLLIVELSNNKISDISDLALLDSLQQIGVGMNLIHDISPLLPFIQRHKNELKIPAKISWTEKYNELAINDNPLNSPPIEIVLQGPKAILNYFTELDKQGINYLYEAKMLIVGQPRAGKTSLRYKLLDINAELPEEDKTTRGIDIERIKFDTKDNDGNVRPFYYNVWDFGGQQIYQTTHQFFLTHRSLYVLVMDTGKDSIGNDDTTINYWLQAVELLGGNSPLLLVQNEKNERKVHVDLPQKKSRFPFLKGDYHIDLNALIPGTVTYDKKRKNDFDNLKQDIETELSRLPLVGFPMPANWIKIREELQGMSTTLAYIRFEKYKQICSRFDIIEYEKQLELSRIFHDLGVFLHFQDYGILDDFIVLQNTWATDAVFAVLDNEIVKQNKGRFTDSDLAGIWKANGYDKEVHKKLLGLMMQFELCYQVDKTKPFIYIVPEMLPDSAPAGYAWQPNNDLPLQYRYDFMPKGLLTRLIVRLNRNIYTEDNQQLVWKTGVKIDGNLMDCLNTYAEIREAWDNRQLIIRIQGKFSKDLMSKITHEIDELNKDYFKQVNDSTKTQKSKWYKMIPCTCETCKESKDKHYYDYSKLLKRKDFGKNTIGCEIEPFAEVNIDELLDGVFSKRTGQPIENKELKRIFISYAHKDEKWKDKLIANLSSLRNQELIADWNDRKIEAGLWDPQIEAAMEESDIFLLLITENFLSSAYITSKEITKAYSLYKSGKAKIFPVICDSCDWGLQPITKEEKELHPVENKEMYPWLGKFQPFPKDGKPIKNWTNQQNGFMDVINQLKKYL